MHGIHLEDDAKPVRKIQRILNPHIKEVVQKGIVKRLDADIIYLISNSQWISLVQVVHKESGITVVRNNKCELIPAGHTTGWSMH